MNSKRILKNLNKTPNWGKIQTQIGKAVWDYNVYILDPNKADPAAGLRGLLPQYWQAVRGLNIYQWGKEDHLPINVPYDVGIFLVGFSSLPIVLSIAEIQPRKEIYFIHSKDTVKKCDEITNRFTEMLKDPPSPFSPLLHPADAASLIKRVKCAKRREIADPSDPVSTFQEIKDIIDDVRGDSENEAHIALDLTGGKKTMIGGGFTAGSIYSVSPKCDMFYVDSLEYEPDRGAPKPGTEFLSRLENPYDVYNVQSVGQAKELFTRHNYEAAAVLWDDVNKKLGDSAGQLQSPAKRYGLTAEQDAVKKNLGMATCYRFWDAFDYGEAQQYKISWAYNNWHIQGQLDVLNVLCEVRGRQTLFDLANEARVIHYATDRYQNGIRAQASDKLDDAMVRFTQVIEMLCIYRICQIASTKNLIEKRTGRSLHETWCADTSWRVSSLISFLFDQPSDYDSEYKISDPSAFLREVDYMKVSDIIQLIQPRNHFIHFTRRVNRTHTARKTEELKELAERFLKNFSKDYCDETGLSFDKLLKLHEFRQLQ